MDFVVLTLGLVFVGFLILVGLGRAFESHRVADFLDWKPTRSPEVEAQNEIDDVRQMIEAQNEYRRKRGAKEITEADVERQAREDQALRARGSGPFAQGGQGEVMDELDQPRPARKRASAARTGAGAKKGAGTKKTAGSRKRAGAKKGATATRAGQTKPARGRKAPAAKGAKSPARRGSGSKKR